MRFVPLLISAIITTVLVVLLNTQFPTGEGKTPRLGYFLSPLTGFWQNAEPTNASFNGQIAVKGISSKTEVYFNDRLVPHIYATTDADAYYVQGFLHAKFRLWQMEFQTHIAAGRLSEIQGEKGLKIDKYFRRLGMVYAAENSLKVMEANPETKATCDAYTAGVNAYIHQLKPAQIPLEYKLLDYRPEPWTNLKTALFLKFMSFDLSGQGDEDLLATNTKDFFGIDTYNKLFPLAADSLDPILAKGTIFAKPSKALFIPKDIDSNYFGKCASFNQSSPIIPNKNNGSNNWAATGSKTLSGRPILCNDPHLGLNLPSLWYEMQITTPTYSTYGISFPGAPCVIIGFNDSCAWGVTNAGRDVKDYYAIQFKDSSQQAYWVNGSWKKTTLRKEVILIKGKPADEEAITITDFGLVMYDKTYPASDKSTRNYAVRWKAHEGSNELQTFYKLNRAHNKADYIHAIETFECPGQNFIFASKSGDIAIRQQGKFVAKWQHQGEFVMPADTAYAWQGFVPANEQVQDENPPYGYLSSANQMETDSAYPYYLGAAANFPIYRGIIINQKLSALTKITPANMQQMQTSNENVFAKMAQPLLVKLLTEQQLTAQEKKYCGILQQWNGKDDINQQGATVFKILWDSLKEQTWGDEYAASKLQLLEPDNSTLLEALLRDTNFVFADDCRTPNKVETMRDNVAIAFLKASKKLYELERKGQLDWGVFKDTKVSHLTKLDALSCLHLPIGGGANDINATTYNHGPSWRMVVQLTDPIEAYGSYPGGQSGNPGSKYYDNFVSNWAAGNYYPLLFVNRQNVPHNSRIKWHITFIKA